MRHHAGDEHADRDIETTIRQASRLGIQFEQRLDIRKPQRVHPVPCNREHVRRKVDAGDPLGSVIQWQGQARADAYLQHAVTRQLADRGNRAAPRTRRECAKYAVVEGRLAAVGGTNVIVVEAGHAQIPKVLRATCRMPGVPAS